MCVGLDEKVTSDITSFKESQIQYPVFVLLFMLCFNLQQGGAGKISLASKRSKLVNLWRV